MKIELMQMPEETLFFPQLARRVHYSNGKKYTDYRQEISEDCQHRCVYCDSHEDVMGGFESMQLEHYHPQRLFPTLINDPLNLLWVCSRCNLHKGRDWHAIDMENVKYCLMGYLDPFAVNRNDFFKVEPDGSLSALAGPADYTIKRLNLNREFLVNLRQKRRLIDSFRHQIGTHFENEIEYHQEAFTAGLITQKTLNKRIKKSENMAAAILDFVDQFANI